MERLQFLKYVFNNKCIFQTLAFGIAVLYGATDGRDQTSVQGIQGAFYVITAQIIFTTSHGVSYMYPSLLPILRRETGENVYSLSAFYIAKIICNIPKGLIDAFAFLGIVFIFSGFLNDFWMYLNIGLILAATGITANAYGCMISGLFESPRMTSEIAPPIDVLSTILGGLYLKLNIFPHLKLLSIFFHSNEAMALTYWHGVTELGIFFVFFLYFPNNESVFDNGIFSDCAPNYNGSCYKNGTEVLESYSYLVNYNDIWKDYFGLLVLFSVFHFIGFVGVRRMTKKVGFY